MEIHLFSSLDKKALMREAQVSQHSNHAHTIIRGFPLPCFLLGAMCYNRLPRLGLAGDQLARGPDQGPIIDEEMSKERALC